MSSRRLPHSTSRNLKLLITQNEGSMDIGDSQMLQQEDEMKEVSSQLLMVRKRHDQAREQNLKKKTEMDNLKKELEKLSSVQALTDGDQRAVDARIEQLRTGLEMTKNKVEEELQNKRIYEHMLARMKQEKIACEVKANSLQSNLKSARQILEAEKERARKSNEARYSSKQMLKEIRESLQAEKRQKEERIQQLEQTARQRKEAAQRREERLRRQAEIAEAAAHEDKDAEEIRLREVLSVHRFWYNVLKWKLQQEMQAAADVEEAFQQIRAATGISNVNEVIEQFLNREEHHSQLMTAVAEAEHKLDNLREENERTRHEFQELQLVQGEGVSREFVKEIKGLDQQIADQAKVVAASSEKLEKASEVYEKVREWGIKVLSRLAPEKKVEVVIASKIEENPDSLQHLYEAIRDTVKEFMEQIEDRKEEVQQKLIEQAHKKTSDIVAEITTDEFLAKNVRIRPRKDESDSDSDEERKVG